MKKNAPPVLALFILLPAFLLAQQRQIKGKITDESGAPVPDVSVGLKGNPAQTRSAAEGTFAINAPNGNVELVFTHGNYPEKTVMASGNNVSVTLQQSSRQLDEVVVVGYGISYRLNEDANSIAEGKRWHDLVRTGKVLTVMAAFDASDDVTNKMNAITANDIIYPIAQSQLSVSPGLYNQNPGY